MHDIDIVRCKRHGPPISFPSHCAADHRYSPFLSRAETRPDAEVATSTRAHHFVLQYSSTQSTQCIFRLADISANASHPQPFLTRHSAVIFHYSYEELGRSLRSMEPTAHSVWPNTTEPNISDLMHAPFANCFVCRTLLEAWGAKAAAEPAQARSRAEVVFIFLVLNGIGLQKSGRIERNEMKSERGQHAPP